VRATRLMPEDVVVVPAGDPDAYDAELRSLATELGLSDRILVLGFVADRTLEALWQIADDAAFPTLGEGFGLPVLEAMVRGVPVACSDLLVLHEVGRCAFLLLPHDERAAAQAIGEALSGGERIPAGEERATCFTWENAARGTFEAYQRAVANARS
jgi:glycosyltransferase involved in cell wall biosynthesis